jgi:molecular chaperone GrpE (heat shock protein)
MEEYEKDKEIEKLKEELTDLKGAYLNIMEEYEKYKEIEKLKEELTDLKRAYENHLKELHYIVDSNTLIMKGLI